MLGTHTFLQGLNGECLVCIFFLVLYHRLKLIPVIFGRRTKVQKEQREFSDSPAEPSNPETKARRQSHGAMYSLWKTKGTTNWTLSAMAGTLCSALC